MTNRYYDVIYEKFQEEICNLINKDNNYKHLEDADLDQFLDELLNLAIETKQALNGKCEDSPRFTKETLNDKIYIVDNTSILYSLPTNIEADEETITESKHINDWLNYLNWR